MALAAAVMGFCGVAAGAFGAHALRERIDPGALEIWRTGAHYLQLHAVAVLALAAWARGRPSPDILLSLSARALVAGASLFFVTLAGLATGGPRWLGAITPVAAARESGPRPRRPGPGPHAGDRP